MGKKKDLEETIKEKVAPLLEESMERSLGITIPKIEADITDKLKKPSLSIYVPFDMEFDDAKKVFKKEFFKRELNLHLGNITQMAKELEMDRRSVHRTIKELDIDIDKLRGDVNKSDYYENMINKAIKSSLSRYEEIIKSDKMKQMYQEIPTLSRNIAKFLPHTHMSWKETEKEFEKQFLGNALKLNKWNIKKTSEEIGIRQETLHRKIKKLSLKKD